MNAPKSIDRGGPYHEAVDSFAGAFGFNEAVPGSKEFERGSIGLTRNHTPELSTCVAGQRCPRAAFER